MPARADAALSPAQRRVLVVDDDPDIRESLGEVLSDAGFGVTLAANGREALERLGEDVAVILLDLMMPVMDGWQFRDAQRSVDAFRDIPVVVVSADGNVAEKAAQIEAHACLRKPVNIVDLLDVLERLAG